MAPTTAIGGCGRISTLATAGGGGATAGTTVFCVCPQPTRPSHMTHARRSAERPERRGLPRVERVRMQTFASLLRSFSGNPNNACPTTAQESSSQRMNQETRSRVYQRLYWSHQKGRNEPNSFRFSRRICAALTLRVCSTIRCPFAEAIFLVKKL